MTGPEKVMAKQRSEGTGRRPVRRLRREGTVFGGVPVLAQWKQIQLGTMRLQVRSLASLSELKLHCYSELWCRLKMRLGSGVAVAVV